MNYSSIYLDHAAAAPMDESVLSAMKPYFSEKFYNPSAIYLGARQVSEDLDQARGKVAGLLGSRPVEIIFTAGGSEANNLAIKGVLDANPGSNILLSSIEHDSVIKPASLYENSHISIDADGIINTEELKRNINDKTALVSIMLANNEIGTIQPIKQISQIISDVRAARKKNGNKLPIYLHTDACQAAAYLDLQVSRLGVDLMTLNGGKIYGPKQSGALYVKAGTILKPLVNGGGQEYGLRSGTENVAGIVGFARALELVQNRRHQESDRLEKLQNLFIKRALKEISGTALNGHRKKRLPNNVHLTFEGQDNERIVMALDEAGIICAAGSACSASNDKPSHVLEAIGLSKEQARSSVRLSMGASTSEAKINQTIEELKNIIND